MKKIKIFISLITLAMFIFFSCEKMEDFHYDYIKDGEIRYATKFDSVITYAGNNRVIISGILNQAFGVDKITVYYNDYSDSLLVDYNRINEIDTIDIMLDNLEEKSYSFNIYTSDDDGNTSIMVSAFATSYGELYRTSLLGRAIESDSAQGSDVYINWLPAEELERGSEIVYTNTSGTEVSLVIPSDSSNVILTDFIEGIKYRSLFVPETTALDSFASDWIQVELQIFESAGIFTHPLLGPRNFSETKILHTLGELVYETDFADLGSYGYKMKLIINENNQVELISTGTTPVAEPNGVNVYDPATETFTLNYKYYHSTGDRLISETLVKK